MVRATVIALLLATAPAHADEPITSTDYAIELADGVALGNTQQVGMGGAGAALIVGTSGGLLNPAAPAVRLTTDTDTWSWDYHVDWLNGDFSTDYDNNGRSEDGGAQLLTGGIGVRYHDWAVALTATAGSTPLQNDLSAEALRARLMVAKLLPRWDLAIGAGVQTASFSINPDAGARLFSVTGAGIMAGATWLPKYRDFRVAAAWESPILGANVDSSCDPMNCAGYILPERIASPWRVVAGGAYRFAPTTWNQLVGGYWRDEPSLTLAADVVVTGASRDAYGVEAFADQMLQPTGRRTTVSVRGGAEYEWLPGRLRWRAGAYWEPSRYDGVGGRVHGTFGVEARAFQFYLWGHRRGRVSFTGDVASRYRNIALSVGFWH